MTKKGELSDYTKSLLLPRAKSPSNRRVWAIDLETVWLPFFTASNTTGDTAIPLDALGCPIRLAKDKDGSVKFRQDGRPVTRVAKTISDCVTLMRESFVANLQGQTEKIVDERQQDYAKQVEMAQKAGQPFIAKDKAELDKAIQQRIEAEMEQARLEALKEKVAPEVATTEPEPEPELVAVS